MAWLIFLILECSGTCLLVPALPPPEPDPFVGHGFVGVTIERTEPVVVSSVTPGGPAEKAGAKVGDVIVSIDGVDAPTGDDVISLVGSVRPKSLVEIEIRRDGEKMKLKIICGMRDDEELGRPPDAPSVYRK